MTQEQYNRVVEIVKKIEELEFAKTYLRDMEFRCNCINSAKHIISKFRIMTNREIDSEIEKL